MLRIEGVAKAASFATSSRALLSGFERTAASPVCVPLAGLHLRSRGADEFVPVGRVSILDVSAQEISVDVTVRQGNVGQSVAVNLALV